MQTAANVAQSAVDTSQSSLQLAGDQLFATYQSASLAAQQGYDNAHATIVANYNSALDQAYIAAATRINASEGSFQSALVTAQSTLDQTLQAAAAQFEQSLQLAEATYDTTVAPYQSARDQAYTAYLANPENAEAQTALADADAALVAVISSAKPALTAAYDSATAVRQSASESAGAIFDAAIASAGLLDQSECDAAQQEYASAVDSAWDTFQMGEASAFQSFNQMESDAWSAYQSGMGSVNAQVAISNGPINSQFNADMNTALSMWQIAESSAWQTYTTALTAQLGAPVPEQRVFQPATFATASQLTFGMLPAVPIAAQDSPPALALGVLQPASFVQEVARDVEFDVSGYRFRWSMNAEGTQWRLLIRAGNNPNNYSWFGVTPGPLPANAQVPPGYPAGWGWGSFPPNGPWVFTVPAAGAFIQPPPVVRGQVQQAPQPLPPIRDIPANPPGGGGGAFQPIGQGPRQIAQAVMDLYFTTLPTANTNINTQAALNLDLLGQVVANPDNAVLRRAFGNAVSGLIMAYSLRNSIDAQLTHQMRLLRNAPITNLIQQTLPIQGQIDILTLQVNDQQLAVNQNPNNAGLALTLQQLQQQRQTLIDQQTANNNQIRAALQAIINAN